MRELKTSEKRLRGMMGASAERERRLPSAPLSLIIRELKQRRRRRQQERQQSNRVRLAKQQLCMSHFVRFFAVAAQLQHESPNFTFC